jgi:inner membrane protein
MEPVTHMLTGAVLARTGFNRRAAYATAAMVIAAEFPDIDTLWSFGGPVAGLEHHRGITHTFVGVPVEAALITAAFYVFHRLRQRRAESNARPTKAPPNWLWLYAGTLLALLSHLLLDWTNNYGIRPFFPFNPHWYAGSFVFIFEPVLFVLLIAGLVLPALFALINAEVGARKKSFPSPGWSGVTLLLIAALYVFRFNEHARALQLAAANAPPDATRFFASPHPVNPWLWSTIAETPAAYQLATVHTNTGLTDPSIPSDTLYKPETTLALLAAKRTYLGQIYLDWSQFPVLEQSPDNSDPHHPLTRVTFSDARFYNITALRQSGALPPLSGSVLLDMQAPAPDRLLETRLDGRQQH